MWKACRAAGKSESPYHVMFHGERGTMTLSDSTTRSTIWPASQWRVEKVQSGDSPHFGNSSAPIRSGTRLNSEIEEAHKSTLLCISATSAPHRRALRGQPEGRLHPERQGSHGNVDREIRRLRAARVGHGLNSN